MQDLNTVKRVDDMRIDAVQTIKDRLTMREVLERYGYTADRKGFICCPFHSEKTPSMKVYEKDYHCFGCQEHGDVITFVQKLFGLSFQDTLRKIDTDFSLGLPIGERIDKRRQTDMARQSFLRKQEQKKKEEEHEKYLTAWLDAHSELIRLERQKIDYRPKSVCDELHPKFIEALQNIEYAKYRLGCMEEELMEYEKRNG